MAFLTSHFSDHGLSIALSYADHIAMKYVTFELLLALREPFTRRNAKAAGAGRVIFTVGSKRNVPVSS